MSWSDLEEQKLLADMRGRQRAQDKRKRVEKAFEDYDWDDLIATGKIGRLKVQELDKYLNHHQIPICGLLKNDKIEAIRCHYYQGKSTATEKETSDSCDTETSSSDSDIVEEEFGSEQDHSASEVYLFTRSGRRATTWKTRYHSK